MHIVDYALLMRVLRIDGKPTTVYRTFDDNSDDIERAPLTANDYTVLIRGNRNRGVQTAPAL